MAAGNLATYCGSKHPSEKLFGHRPRSQPIVGHCAQFLHPSAHLVGREHAKDAAIFFEPPYELAESCAARSIEREAPEIDAGLLTDLHERQAEVGIVMEAFRTDFVEDRRSAVVVAASEEPNQFGHAVGRPTGSPSATHVRPCTPYMMNASRRSSKIRALSSR